jgi:acetylornithine deacetylase
VPERIRREFAYLRQTVTGFDGELDVKRTDLPFTPSRRHLLQDLLPALTGHQPTTIAFGSEAAHLRSLAEEVIVIGPGDMGNAHRTGEFAPSP